MPELAEVEFYRRQWDRGVGGRILRVAVHADKRVFRGTDVAGLQRHLPGARHVASEAHGKQMMFSFSGGMRLGVHLGMTGELRVEPRDYAPARHDHLVLFQRARSFVFEDARQFGRVLFFRGTGDPPWWNDLPPSIDSRRFSIAWMNRRLQRHRTLPLKAGLLDQSTFPGIGNWMADEILWQTRLHPRRPAGSLDAGEVKAMWRQAKFVVRRSVETVAANTGIRGFGDPPRGWLFHQRWRPGGKCPRDRAALVYETIGGRTTAWCPRCQRM